MGERRAEELAVDRAHRRAPDRSERGRVAALGNLWARGGERGLYVTRDGGKTWRAALQAGAPYADRVGCGDVALDPSAPDTSTRRSTPGSASPGPSPRGPTRPTARTSAASSSPPTAAHLDEALERPAGLTGRIGLSVHRKNPQILYSVVQSSEGGTSGIDDVTSKSGGVFRSDDGGESWSRRSNL